MKTKTNNNKMLLIALAVALAGLLIWAVVSGNQRNEDLRGAFPYQKLTKFTGIKLSPSKVDFYEEEMNRFVPPSDPVTNPPVDERVNLRLQRR